MTKLDIDPSILVFFSLEEEDYRGNDCKHVTFATSSLLRGNNNHGDFAEPNNIPYVYLPSSSISKSPYTWYTAIPLAHILRENTIPSIYPLSSKRPTSELPPFLRLARFKTLQRNNLINRIIRCSLVQKGTLNILVERGDRYKNHRRFGSNSTEGSRSLELTRIWSGSNENQ